MHKLHGYVNPVRTLFQGTQCLACMKEYHTAAKLKAHLLWSTPCRMSLVGSRIRYGPLGGSGSHADLTRRAAHDRLLPPLPVAGPLPLPGPQTEFDLVHWDGHDACCLDLLDVVSNEDVEPCLRARLSSLAISWTVCRITLRQLYDTVQEHGHEEALRPLDTALLLEAISHLMRPDAWPFLQTLHPTQVTSSDLSSLEQTILSARAPPTWPAPSAFGRHRIVLHAFSGRRRLGDFQYYLDTFIQQSGSGFVIHTVSLDIMVDKHKGDISDPQIRQYWMHAIDAKWILAFLAGPPCETWSKARGVLCDDGARPGPRIIRTIDELWGKGHLRLRELDQIDVGNLLLCFSAEAFLHLAAVGGSGAIEHPKEPDDPALASIWRLPLFRMLRHLPGVELHAFSQGLLGASSPKPTNLLCLNLPDLQTAILRHRVTSSNPSQIAIGRTQAGQWATSALKEYPPALNRALACTFFTAINQPSYDEALVVDAEFLQTCKAMTVTEFSDHMGRDFAR